MIPVKWFNSAMPNAPVLSNAAGSLISVLDACLVTGFNIKTLNTLSSANGIATASVLNGHGFNVNEVVLISGANESEYNGEFRVISVTATTFSFSVSGNPAPASGVITARYSSAGWEKLFSASNKAVYRSLNVSATRLLLRVEDNISYSAICRMYEVMSDVDNGTGMSPIVYAGKSNQGDTTARSWALYADSLSFYLFVDRQGDGNWNYGALAFGDLPSFKAGDAYNCMLIGSLSSTLTYSWPLVINGDTSGSFIARSHTQLGGYVSFGRYGCGITQYSGNSTIAYPNPANNSLLLSPIYVAESASMRGIMPGMYSIINSVSMSQGAFIQHPELGLGIIQHAYSGGVVAARAFISLEAWR